MNPRRLAVVIAAVVCAFLGAGPAAAHAAGSQPRLFTGNFGEKPFEVRPAVVSYTGDGTGYLGGRQVAQHRCGHPPGCFGSLHWRRWGSDRAVAKGVDWINNCRPDCADGTFYAHRARVVASHVRRGKFRRLTIAVRLHHHKSVDRRKLARSAGNYFWAVASL